MFVRSVILIVMSIVLFGWVIFCAVQFVRHSRDVVAEAGFIGHVKCEKCGTEYEVKAEEFTKSYVSKYKSVTKTKMQGGVLILAAASIPLHFADQAREQKVEELREQQYEEFKERYGL